MTPRGYIFNFGKYEGRPVKEVPKYYLHWVIDNFNNQKSRWDRFWTWVCREELKRRKG